MQAALGESAQVGGLLLKREGEELAKAQAQARRLIRSTYECVPSPPSSPPPLPPPPSLPCGNPPSSGGEKGAHGWGSETLPRRLPERRTFCEAERAACIKCYQVNKQDPLKCSTTVAAFSECATRAQKGVQVRS